MLGECLQSVWAQSLTDFEIIICDNNSSDSTERYITGLQKKHKEITYLRSDRDLAMIENWNRGLAAAEGEYVAVLMDDDVWEPQFLEKTVHVLKKHRDVGIVAVQPVPWYAEGAGTQIPRDHYRLYSADKKLSGRECIEMYIRRCWRVGLPSAVITRRECIQSVGFFREPGLDAELWLRILSKYNFYYLDKPLTKWRIHTYGSYTSDNSKSRIENLYVLMRAIHDVYENIQSRDDGTMRLLKNETYKEMRREAWQVYASLPLSVKIKAITALVKILVYDS